MKTKQLLKRFWHDEAGQSTTEYILILSVVVMIALKFKDQIGKQLDTLLNRVNSDMTRAMDQN